MSKDFLKKLLDEEIEQLKKKGGGKAARAESDKKVHSFFIGVDQLYEEIYRQLQFKSIPVPRSLDKIIYEGAEDIVDFAMKKAESYAKTTDNVEILEEEDGFIVVTYEALGTFSAFFTDKQGRKRKIEKENSVFQTVKGYYLEPKNKLVEKINKFLLEETGEEDVIDKGNFLDLGHQGQTAVVRQRITGSQRDISSKISARNKAKSGKDVITPEMLATLKLDFTLTKNDGPNRTTIATKVEAAGPQRAEGSSILAKEKNDFVKLLTEAVKSIDGLALSKGSDSRVELDRKRLIKAFNDSVKGGKNLKKTSTNTKPNPSKNTKAKKSLKIKQKKGKVRNATLGKLPIKAVKRKSGNSDITLAALINRKLPATVAKNMKLPGLQYRTGRFANSVEITDITRTSQGFPSIGYTYQRNPYQTFEPGGKQGSTDRDPRKVIDKSIREIAAGLLVGRFYTRRV